jgi:hypothetical protein
MHDTEAVEIVEGSRHLMSDMSRDLLREAELALFQEGEEIPSTQILHHDVHVVLILKDIL